MCNLKKLTMKFYKIFIITTLLTTVQSCGPGRGINGHRRLRKLTPLVFKQHLPNLSENTLGASGLQEEKISREHPKFQRLVPNYNRDIIFRDEEGTGADRLMSERCKEKLNTLAMSVMNQWPGVRVRVIEAWDEDDYHGPDSLHYEGRAVDITTSDRDRSKYGMLARLAVEAGFDWVYYESRAHIHCSVKSDSSQASHITGCFTGDSTVQTSTGETRRLSELQIGEQVLSVNTRGESIYSEVIMFLDRDESQQRDFVKIQTDSDATIVATPAHLLLVWNRDIHETSFMFAARIQEGDYLFVNINGTLEPRQVKYISSVVSKGVFAPLTKEGTVVVDSIAASCYALINSQSIAHWSFLPYRTVRNIIHWFTANRTVFPRDIGIHPYAKFLYDMKDYVIPTNWLYK